MINAIRRALFCTFGIHSPSKYRYSESVENNKEALKKLGKKAVVYRYRKCTVCGKKIIITD